MKKNPVKAALKAGKPQVGTWLSLGNVFAARFMARTGFPWLTVDLEHSPIDWSDAAICLAAIADAGCVPIARVPRGDHDHIKRVLDGGAMGVVIPMVNTVAEAKSAIAAAKYPPSDYYKHANDEILVILQTESPEGVDNAEAIYSLEAMLQRVLAAGKKTGTPVGLHVQSPADVQKRIEEGWQFIAIGSELRMMLVGAQDIVNKLNLKQQASDLARY